MIQLSKRLQTIADFVDCNTRVADIGSDHAMLPVYLVQSGRARSAIAGELNKGPFEAARAQVAGALLTERVDVRHGDGLSVVQPNEVDTITISGMGGALIVTILEAGRQAGKLIGVQQLVLQPNVGEDVVRRWLLAHEWALVDETILEEDGKIYEILVARRIADFEAQMQRLYDVHKLPQRLREQVEANQWLQRMGPYLIQRGGDVFHSKWQLECEKLTHICKQLQSSELSQSHEKLAIFQQEIETIKEILRCT